jgi:hypothetical protein
MGGWLDFKSLLWIAKTSTLEVEVVGGKSHLIFMILVVVGC